MIFYETPLGRRVNNRWDYLMDAVLKYLFDWHDDPFNEEDIPVLPERIAQDLDAPTREIKDILRYLEEEKRMVKSVSEGTKMFYKISVKGIAYVERHIYKLK